MPLIELQGVTKRYDDNGVPVTALHPIDLSVSNGEFVCIAGPSGSGKTTLLNIIGLIDTPSGGEIFFDNNPVSGLNRTAGAALRLKKIGFVFQAHNLIPVLSAYENVEYVLLLKRVRAEERRERVSRTLAHVGLANKMKKLPGELSGGEQQRVAVARAIVASPPLVLADEPTASLDSATGEELVNLFHSIAEREGTIFVFSSHDPKIIDRAGRVIILLDGRIADDRRR
jgi:putative ABC transport system ATP-binding protein